MSGEDIRENVIKGLECCTDGMMCKRERCPYYGKSPINSTCRIELEKDVLALLKAQDNTVCTKERCPMNANTISDDCNIKTCPWRTEGVEPQLSMSGLWYECPVCGKHLTRYEDNYCARCGKRVKWNA